MTNLIRGMEIIDAWTDQLNEICTSGGGIERDNPNIWEIMHSMPMEDWANLITALEEIYRTSPGTFRDYHLNNLQLARQAFDKADKLGKDFVGRPLIAKSGNKAAAWRLVMTMRETVNDYNGKYIANRPKG